MSERLAEKFVDFISRKDTMTLFRDVLVEKYGSIARACEEVGIERKTFYNWEKAREISRDTRARVLAAALRADRYSTLLFIAKILREKIVSALFEAINYLATSAAKAGSAEELSENARLLRTILREFSRPLIDELRAEIRDTKQVIEYRALELGADPAEIFPEDYALIAAPILVGPVEERAGLWGELVEATTSATSYRSPAREWLSIPAIVT